MTRRRVRFAGNRAARTECPAMSRGVIIAAPGSGSGKTTLTLALLRSWRDGGVAVASAKVGPDYIDPAYHAAASGRTCHNLDTWSMSDRTMAALIADLRRDASAIVVEGVMGLFDGAPDGRGSAADLSRRTGWPVVLVVDASGMAASVAALVHGFASYDPAVEVAGVIFNRTGSARHGALLRRAMRPAGVPVFGCVTRSECLELPDRHLGLVQAREHPDLEGFLARAADRIGREVDTEALLAAAKPARAEPRFPSRDAPLAGGFQPAAARPARAELRIPPRDDPLAGGLPPAAARPARVEPRIPPWDAPLAGGLPPAAARPARVEPRIPPWDAPLAGGFQPAAVQPVRVEPRIPPRDDPLAGEPRDGGHGLPVLGRRIAVARDDAFAFCYPYVLDAWRRAGCTLSFFSPLDDEPPAEDADAVYLPGGYPELHAARLARAERFKAALGRCAARGAAVYGECGGYMVLGERLVAADGVSHRMAGLLPVATSFESPRLSLGYREVALVGDGVLGRKGARFRGHEFHFATAPAQSAGNANALFRGGCETPASTNPSRSQSTGNANALFRTFNAEGEPLGDAGLRVGNVMGSFVHLMDRCGDRPSPGEAPGSRATT